MGLPAALRLTRSINASTPAPTRTSVPYADWATWPNTATASVGTVSRDLAMTVPAMARARDLIANTIGTLPLEAWNRNGTQVETPRLLGQPDPECAAVVTYAWTADDLLFHGVSYWLVLDRDPADGRPSKARRVPPGDVTITPEGAFVTDYGSVRPVDLLRFEAPHEGILWRGARPLRTSVALEQASLNYATSPLPAAALRSNDGTYLDDEEVTALLATWEQKRQAGSTAFLQSAELQTFGWSARDLQLVEARQYQALEVSRLTGVPAAYLNSEVGASLTYQNMRDIRRDLLAFTLAPYMAAVTQRLSMTDITPGTQLVRYGLTEFLASTPTELAQVQAVLVPLGVMTVDEARATWDLAPTATDPPAQPAPEALT